MKQITACALILIALGCAKSTPTSIVGTWQFTSLTHTPAYGKAETAKMDGRIRLEFTSDNRFHSSGLGASIDSGSYTVIDSTHLVMKGSSRDTLEYHFINSDSIEFAVRKQEISGSMHRMK